ncbi:hypothetical protein WG66_000446 [Moniliophthora roreri]|nr:hypothetical protein WG66_000446 [Moniliophthora roreri]
MSLEAPVPYQPQDTVADRICQMDKRGLDNIETMGEVHQCSSNEDTQFVLMVYSHTRAIDDARQAGQALRGTRRGTRKNKKNIPYTMADPWTTGHHL